MAQASETNARKDEIVFSQRREIRRTRLILLKKTFDQVALFVEH